MFSASSVKTTIVVYFFGLALLVGGVVFCFWAGEIWASWAGVFFALAWGGTAEEGTPGEDDYRGVSLGCWNGWHYRSGRNAEAIFK